MNQTFMLLSLRQFTTDDHPFGNIQGRETFRKLADFVESNPKYKIFGISLNDIKATDASFPRESVVALAKQYRGEKGFFLQDLHSKDLIDNWRYAAQAKDQPLVIWNGVLFEIIGPPINSSTETLIKYVLENRSVTASKTANDLNISVANASTRLKRLVNEGYIMRSEEIAASGGIEYIYMAIKNSA